MNGIEAVSVCFSDKRRTTETQDDRFVISHNPFMPSDPAIALRLQAWPLVGRAVELGSFWHRDAFTTLTPKQK